MSSEKSDESVFPHTIIALGERPLCVWDPHLKQNNRTFLEAVYPDWFLEVASNRLKDVEDDEEISQSAAITIRYTYHHAKETFFALLFAVFQAPHCIPAWLDLYQISDIRDLITRIETGGPVLNAWAEPRPGWDGLANLFLLGWQYDKEDRRKTVERFARVWSRLAQEFKDPTARSEYNALKHGFRAVPSGFALRAGIEDEPGVEAPPEAMKTIGASRHGSASFTIEPVLPHERRRSAVHVKMRSVSVPWLIDTTLQKIALLTMSMQNVIGAAKVRNGVGPDQVRFHRFAEEEAYDMPWSKSTGVTHFSMTVGGPGEHVAQVDREHLLRRLREASGIAST